MSPRSESARITETARAGEYSDQERRILLRLAHESIESALSGKALDPAPPTEHLAELRGAFTTLRLEGGLRGCIGYVFPSHSLYRTIAETARAAAFDDPRFPPVTPSEAPALTIEISVLSPLQPIRPEEVIVGKHGLVITSGGRRGLLLPQVPLQWGWDRETFLEQTCLKAGLPPQIWHTGAIMEAFTAEVFGEDECLV